VNKPVAVPDALVADTSMEEVPAVVGVPEIKPEAVSIVRPSGRPVAAKEFGAGVPLAVIW
jgi:hypothetical protein